MLEKSLTTDSGLKLARKSPEQQKDIISKVADMAPAEANQHIKKSLSTFSGLSQPATISTDAIKTIKVSPIERLKAMEAALLEKHNEYLQVWEELRGQIGDYQLLTIAREQLHLDTLFSEVKNIENKDRKRFTKTKLSTTADPEKGVYYEVKR